MPNIERVPKSRAGPLLEMFRAVEKLFGCIRIAMPGTGLAELLIHEVGGWTVVIMLCHS